MFTKKTLVGAAVVALTPLALMAPANAYYKIGSCTPNSASITLTVTQPGTTSWDVSGHIGDGQGRTWNWKLFRNGTLYDTGTVTGTSNVNRIFPVNTTKVRFEAKNAAGTVSCAVVQDGIS
jgi:hypothetical protein